MDSWRSVKDRTCFAFKKTQTTSLCQLIHKKYPLTALIYRLSRLDTDLLADNLNAVLLILWHSVLCVPVNESIRTDLQLFRLKNLRVFFVGIIIIPRTIFMVLSSWPKSLREFTRKVGRRVEVWNLALRDLTVTLQDTVSNRRTS